MLKAPFVVVLLLASAFAACAKSAHEKPPVSPAAVDVAPPSVEVGAASEPTASAEPASDKTLRPAAGAADPAYIGALDRKGLNEVIDQGLGRVLARLKLSPAMVKGRFEGFRVTEIDPAWTGAGLMVGDVLLRLNGQTIERPEQAQQAFESLRVASEVVLDLNRAGEKRALRYLVE